MIEQIKKEKNSRISKWLNQLKLLPKKDSVIEEQINLHEV